MIIDFHTHIFPEAIAAETLLKLQNAIRVPYYTDGTAAGLRRAMEQAGVGLCVTMPIVTRPGTTGRINDYAAEQAEKYGFLSFGSVHPEEKGWRGQLRRFREIGLVGLKLHHDYQGFPFDSKENTAVIEAAFEEGLPVLVHAGYDPVSPDRHLCTVEMIRDALPLLRQGVFIAAHLGGNMMLERSMRLLLGEDIWIDTSMGDIYYPEAYIRQAILAHDPDKILFGTDSPWDDQARAIRVIRHMKLGRELEEKILEKNARSILPITEDCITDRTGRSYENVTL